MTKQQYMTLLVRVVFGFMFFYHGLVKFTGGISNTVGYFDMLGIPGALAYVVALIELIGGLLLIVGLGTRFIGAIFAIIMIGAIFTAKLPLGLFGDGTYAGYELEVVYLALGIYFMFADRSPLSLDDKLFNKEA
ncbi:DoxX family protein [Lysinibacillus yapensis]|uniref:DoxX family protein n=1 Tax=Ureibacillus yapensis TaxID=2304605 RepID=A0A396SUG8_9BACL|nr:DoxX family protein [Lysinibacillus yapensis]RHW40131.1 DoxX family protein [Lysinibacillus yapensis]